VSYVKSIPIKSTVNKSIAYILNPDKTEDLLFAAGINCIAEKNIAYSQFCGVYQQYSSKLNYWKSGKKEMRIAYHFIQSFKEGHVTPELSHKIAKEWAEKVFGDNRQIVIATHIDKGHIHNHFIVNILDFNGKKYYDNKTTLKRARDIDNEICLKYGIEIIKENKKKAINYKEWMTKKAGTSWKNKIRLVIDKEIMKVQSIEELLNNLKVNGYEVKKGKYISIKPKNVDRWVRTKTLGDNYSEDSLIQRINDKSKELPIIESYNSNQRAKKTKSNNYSGIQLKYVSLIRVMANLIVNGKKRVKKYDSKKPYSQENDYDINLLASQLQLLNREKISTEEELMKKFQEAKNEYEESKKRIDQLLGLAESINGVISNGENYFKLLEKSELTSPEKLKLTITKAVIDKYNIQDKDDFKKLKSKYDITISESNGLRESFDSLMKRYKEFSLLVKTYKAIKDENYLGGVQANNKDNER